MSRATSKQHWVGGDGRRGVRGRGGQQAEEKRRWSSSNALHHRFFFFFAKKALQSQQDVVVWAVMRGAPLYFQGAYQNLAGIDPRSMRARCDKKVLFDKNTTSHIPEITTLGRRERPLADVCINLHEQGGCIPSLFSSKGTEKARKERVFFFLSRYFLVKSFIRISQFVFLIISKSMVDFLIDFLIYFLILFFTCCFLYITFFLVK